MYIPIYTNVGQLLRKHLVINPIIDNPPANYWIFDNQIDHLPIDYWIFKLNNLPGWLEFLLFRLSILKPFVKRQTTEHVKEWRYCILSYYPFECVLRIIHLNLLGWENRTRIMLQLICFIFAKLEESVYFFNSSLKNYSKTSPSTTKKFKKFIRNILNTDRWLRLWTGWIMDLKWQWFWTFSSVPVLSCTDLILWLQQTQHRNHIVQWSIALVYAKSSDHDEKTRNIL